MTVVLGAPWAAPPQRASWCQSRAGAEETRSGFGIREAWHRWLVPVGSLAILLRRDVLCTLSHLSCSWFKARCDCTPTVECRLTFPSYFGSPFSSWLSLPNCSHHGGRFQRSPPEGQGADSVWRSPSGTSNSHSRLSRVSVRFQNKQPDKEIPWPS